MDRKEIERFLAVILFTSTIVAGYGIVSFFIGKDMLFTELYLNHAPFFNESYLEKEGRIFSTFANPVFLSSYLIMCLPLIFYQFRHINILLKNSFKIAIGLILFLALILTFSIRSLISAAAVIIFYFLTNSAFKEFIKQHYRNIILVFAVISLVFIAFFPYLTQKGKYYSEGRNRQLLWGRINVKKLSCHGRIIDRLANFKIGSKTLKKNPCLGTGLGTIGVKDVIKGVTSIDNTYLRLLIETGILGFLAHFGLIAIIILTVYRARKKTINQNYNNSLWAILAIFVAVIINAFSCDIFYLPSHRMLFWIYCGIGVSLTSSLSLPESKEG